MRSHLTSALAIVGLNECDVLMNLICFITHARASASHVATLKPLLRVRVRPLILRQCDCQQGSCGMPALYRGVGSVGSKLAEVGQYFACTRRNS